MSIHVTTKYADTDVDLVFGRYGDGSVAIQAVNADDGMMEFTATVALNRVPEQGNVFIKNWSENEGVYQALLAAGVIGPVILGFQGPSDAAVYDAVHATWPAVTLPVDAALSETGARLVPGGGFRSL